MVAEEDSRGSNQAVLVVKNLTKAFGALIAVKNISLIIEGGRIHSIIGPNGAGKTTLFNLICGNLPCTGGEILFLGHSLTHLPQYKRVRMGIGRTFQITNLFPEYTVGENLMLSMAPKPLGVKSFKVAEKESPDALATLEQFGLADKWGIKVKELSHGEQRELEVIMGLLLNPKVLLLDEPSSGLSSTESSRMCDIIRKIGKETTIVLIEHDLDLVFELSDKITVMHYGEVLSEGSPKAVKSDIKVREAYLGEV